MNHGVLALLASIIIVVLSFELSGKETQRTTDSDKKAEQFPDVREVLKAGKAAGALPEGVVLRVEADVAKTGDSNGLKECWEFTPGQVHQVVVESPKKSGDKVVYRRVKSRRFSSKNLCNELLDGKILAIEAGEGTGNILLFAGTDYRVGHRAIEILVNGKTALLNCEACTGPVFAESDARAFAALYERLAKQARDTLIVMPDLDASSKQ